MSQLIARNLILAAAVTGALAQSPTDSTTFEVASIRPNVANDNRFMFRGGPGLTADGVTLKFLVVHAYGVLAYQVSGGPGWMNTDRWDIRAKAGNSKVRVQSEQFLTMLRALLADRFQLKVHSETKEMYVFALVVAKNGPKLTPHTGPGQDTRVGWGSLSLQKGGTAALAYWLSRQLGRTVVDKTELEGEYNFTLEWQPEPGGGVETLGLPPDPRTSPPADMNRPSIFTAVQEQLGLRLDARKGPVEIIVIDHAEKPSEN
jgi:uncharacterized protein (TIGR03435 family)